MEVAQSPGQVTKSARQGHCRIVSGAKVGEEGGRQSPLPHFWMRSPKSLSFQDKVPQVDAGQGRAGQTRATARVLRSLMTAVFCCRFPSCSGREAGWWGREGGRGKRREVNRRPKREPVPCIQRTPAASGPRWVAVCVEMKLGGEERGKSKHALLGCYHPLLLSRPSSLPPSGVVGVGGSRFTKRPPSSTQSWFSCR